MDRVEMTRPMVRLCYMQVCCEKNTTNREILEACNRLNPSGTRGGWSQVKRKDKFNPPVQCQKDSKRLHVLVSC